MMISLVLSMNMGKMMKDNVLVRKLNGIETAGGLNILFSDKTGTITEGKLSVVELATGNVRKFKDFEGIPAYLKKDIIIGIGVNNSATVSNGDIIGGNSTDRALMSFLLGTNTASEIDKSEVKVFNAFDSNKKSSSVVITRDGKSKTYIKGAPEKIIERCTHYIDETGAVKVLEETNYLMTYMNEQAGKSMRLLGVAVKDGDTDDGDLTLVCILSIRDNVRSTSVEAIKSVRNAGVQVVMITGDRKETAVAIAKEAGLLDSDEDIALTSKELSEKTDDEIKAILPHIRVISRALPSDKSRMVRIAQEMNLVVGMTGDGVNDSPALKKADVGFAMGSGTEVAKEAGDITILDDNFLSIQKAILYGRTIFKNIRKFLIFQLTVNVSTVALCFIAPLLQINQPLSITSILFINLVMDTLASLAFGNEPSLERYMSEKPIRRDESILSKKMAAQILSVGCYIVVISLLVLLSTGLFNMYAPQLNVKDALEVGQTEIAQAASAINPEYIESYKESAMLAFMMLTVILNGFFARSDKFNCFEHLKENKMFLIVMGAVAVMLVVLIHVLGRFASLVPLTLRTWSVMLVLAFGSVIVDAIRKAIMK